MKTLNCAAMGLLSNIQRQRQQTLMANGPVRAFRTSMILAMAAKGPNYYQVLGLKPSASDKEIKMSYFQLAKKYHPDLNPEESARIQFEKILMAYETLSDDQKKQVYDNQQGFSAQSRAGGSYKDYHSHKQRRRANSTIFSDDEGESAEEYYDLYRGRNSDRRTMPGKDGQRKTKRGPTAESQWKQQRSEEQFWSQAEQAANKEQYKEQVFDEFDEFFDFKRQSQETGVTRDDTRGADYKTDVNLNFVNAVVGTKVSVELNKRFVCSSCRGTRAQAGSKPRKCFECSGRGSVIGNYNIKKRCNKCEGAGCIPKVFCSDCDGIGVQRQVITEEISLPAGVKDGQKIKVQNMGHAADVYSSYSGDLLLTLNVAEHNFFKRVEEKDIQTEVELTLAEAILGVQITVSTVHGALTINVEPGTGTGDKKVLKHWGVPEFDPPENYDPMLLRGDHIVIFKVRLPENHSQEIKDILEKIIENETNHKKAYYAYQEELKKQKEEEITQKQARKRAKTSEGQSQSRRQQNKAKEADQQQDQTSVLGGWFSSMFGAR